MQGLVSQKARVEMEQEKKLPHTSTSGGLRSTNINLREIQRRQHVSKEEAQLQKETEGLIKQMHDQACEGEIPEYGKKIIEVLMNYQGNIGLY